MRHSKYHITIETEYWSISDPNWAMLSAGEREECMRKKIDLIDQFLTGDQYRFFVSTPHIKISNIDDGKRPFRLLRSTGMTVKY